ncbi:MAG: TonB-dependent receptor [Bryobacteraceae bacterium]
MLKHFASASGGLLLAAGVLFSQTSILEGIITDPSGAAVRGAVVECDGHRAVSALDGSFRLASPGACQARVQAAGFEPESVQLTPAAPASIRLRLAGVSQTVVVTATRHPASLEESGVAGSVFVRQDLADRQFPPVADLLREVAGTYVATSGRPGHLTSVFTRGAQRTGTLLLLDGVPLNDPGGELNLAHLTSSELERVEVVRGPHSALFGAEASAGVIQLFTRRGDSERSRLRTSASYERGSFGTDQWRASVAGGISRRLGYALHSTQTRTSGEFPNDDYRNTSGSANVGYRLTRSSEIRGVLRIGDSVTGVPGQTAYGLFDRDARETNRGTALSIRFQDARGPHYVQQVSFAWHRLRDVYTDRLMDGPYALAALVRDVPGLHPRTYLVRLLDPTAVPAHPPAGTRTVSQEVWLWPLGDPYLSASSRYRMGYQGTWSAKGLVSAFGYEYERQQGDVSARSVARNNHGLFLHSQKTLRGRIFLAGGVRLEHSSAYGRKFTPRGAVGFRLAGERGAFSSTYLRFSAGRGITEPSLIQTYAREFYAMGNPDLRPEHTNSYEAGLVQEWFGRRARTEVNLFHNSFRDLITFVSLPPPVWGSWRNLDRSHARGLEFSARTRLAENVTFDVAYTRLWSRVLYSNSAAAPFYGAGQELPRRPGNAASLALSVAPSRWSLQVGAVLIGERQDADYYLGVNRNPGYQNVYLSGSLRLRSGWTPFFRAENLLNSRYQEVLGYAARGRGIRMGVRWEW